MADLGTWGGDSSYANGISSTGTVVGDSHYLPYSEPYPPQVNEAGYAIGEVRTLSGGLHPAQWSPTGQLTDLGPKNQSNHTIARDINNQNEIVGYSTSGRPWYWKKGNGFVELPMLDGATNCSALAIDDKGTVVGLCNMSVGSRKAVMWSIGVAAAATAQVSIGPARLVW